jgi:hypothetical protein
MLDFDHIPTERMAECHDRASGDVHTILCYCTPSGVGLRIVVAYPMGSDFTATYEALCHYYSQLLDLPADLQCKDLTRLSFLSSDPTVYYNDTALAFSTEEVSAAAPDSAPAPDSSATSPAADSADSPAAPSERPARRRSRSRGEGSRRPMSTPELMDFVERQLNRSGKAFSAGERNSYVYTFACCLNRYGVTEEEARTLLTTRYAAPTGGFPAAEVESCVRSAYKARHQHGGLPWPTVWEHSDTPTRRGTRGKGSSEGAASGGGGKQPDSFEIYEALTQYINAQYNTFDNTVEVEWLCHIDGTPLSDESTHEERLTDYALNGLAAVLSRDHRYRISPLRIREVLNSPLTPRYNPFCRYLSALAQWDGVTDYVKQLYDLIELMDDRLDFLPLLRKWLVGLVRGMLGIGYNEEILMLVGPEGAGKTTFFYYLLPPELRRYAANSNPQLLDKDTLISASEHCLLVFDEISTLSSGALETLKTLCCTPTMSVRRPYAVLSEQLPRHASFGGTGNNPNFLRDPAGARRWITMMVRRVDSLTLAQMDLRPLYAQLYTLAQDESYNHHLTAAEVIALSAYNNRHSESMESALLSVYFRRPDEGERALLLSLPEVLQRLSVGTLRLNPDMLSRALKQQGFERLHHHGRFVYRLYEKSATDINREREWEE